jgi:hypothetical protein
LRGFSLVHLTAYSVYRLSSGLVEMMLATHRDILQKLEELGKKVPEA